MIDSVRMILMGALLVFPLMAFWAHQTLWPPRSGGWRFFGCITLVSFLLYLGLVTFEFMALEQELMNFDSDGNGYLSLNEESERVQQIRQRLGSIHRSWIPMLGIFLAVAWTGLQYLLFRGLYWLLCHEARQMTAT